ncbi:hypothetical protein A9Q82_09700 [Cycloclasticus sp. 46_120_T64]|nr:hypothetical protein A9Q82_09700 [Cycloclasticus sp. 46_120_T64]
MLNNNTIYKFHVANLHSIQTAIEHLKRTIHVAIASENKKLILSYTRLLSLTLGAWAEVRLNKLLYETEGFSTEEREKIKAKGSQFEKWELSIELAVRSHYGIQNQPLTDTNLTHSVYSRYQTLNAILEQDLKPVIEIRNKLAHGQWEYPFTDGLDLAIDKKIAIEAENVQSLHYKYVLLNHLSQIIHDLIVSKPTFERDFDKYYQKFASTRQHLLNKSFVTFCSDIKERAVRGKEARAQNVANIPNA